MKKDKVYLITTTEGCATNLIENATYRKTLEMSEIENVLTAQEANIIVINTCAYTNDQEDRSIAVIKKYQEMFPDKKVVVGGCLTKINSKKLEEVYSGDTFTPGNVEQFKKSLSIENDIKQEDVESHFFDKSDFVDLTWKHKLVLFLRPILYKTEEIFNKKFQPLHNVLKTSIINEEYYGINVSQGCAGQCTFCSIKTAKGHVKSKPIVQVMHEFQKGIELGQNKIWLLGDDIGCYGLDFNSDFSSLLSQIISVPKEFELVINYFEPYFFLKQFEKIIPLLSDKRVLHINFPIQSGNARIVKEMGRDYDPQIVLLKIEELKKSNPEIVIKTNIIVGFPSETFSEFLDSVRSVFYFDAVLALSFTPRAGTRADKMENQISEVSKILRMIIINTAVWIRHGYIVLKSLI
jgi:MiaB/RimO family radical SAM methylthiotransferase